MLVRGAWRSPASVLAWGARGPGFESRRPDTNTLGYFPGYFDSRGDTILLFNARDQRGIGAKDCSSLDFLVKTDFTIFETED